MKDKKIFREIIHFFLSLSISSHFHTYIYKIKPSNIIYQNYLQIIYIVLFGIKISEKSTFSHLLQFNSPETSTSCTLASIKKCFPHLRKPVTIGGEGGHRHRLYLAACFRVDSLNSASARAASWISSLLPVHRQVFISRILFLYTTPYTLR